MRQLITKTPVKILSYTSANIPSPVAFGIGPIWIDGAEFWSDGVNFVSVKPKSNVFDNLMMRQARIVDIDVQPIDIPTYIVGNNEVVHPSVIYAEQAWNGYHWWMVITPYPAADNKKENPSIFVSLNGTDWIEPSGLTNPVIPEPPSTDFNSDPQLFFGSNNSVLYMIYRLQGGGLTKFFITKSSDGINWSTPFETHSTTFTSERNISPSVNWDASTNEWVIHAIDIETVPYTYKSIRVAEIESSWGTFTAVPITIPPDMVQLWHQEVHINTDGSYYGICVDNDNTGGQQRMLYSKDGINFNVSDPLTLHKGYKSSIVPNPNGTFWVFIGDLEPEWHITRGRIVFDKSTFERASQASMAPNKLALNKLSSGYNFFDTFERADNATTAGSADTGQAWLVVAGIVGIIGNQIYCPVSGNHKVAYDIGSPNFDVTIGVPGEQNGTYLMFRHVDASNFWRIKYNIGAVLKLEKIVGGTLTGIFDIVLTNSSSPAQIRVVCSDDVISIYYNNKFFASIKDSDLNDASEVGLQLTNNAQRVDFFSVETL